MPITNYRRPEHVVIDNFLGVANANIALPGLTVLSGPNGSGKSSVLDALRFALTGEIGRVALKKNWGTLVRDGTKVATIRLSFEEVDTIEVKLSKSGKLDGAKSEKPNDIIRTCLTPRWFATLAATERKAVITELLALKLYGESAKQALLDRRTPATIANELAPFLEGGFAAAEAQASAKLRDLRAQWNAQTGETYGSIKADTWEPTITHPPRASDAVRTAIKRLEEEITEAVVKQNAERAKPLLTDAIMADLSAAIEAGRDAGSRLTEASREKDALHYRLAELGLRIAASELSCPACNAPLLMMADGSGALVERGEESVTQAQLLGEHKLGLATLKIITKREAECRAAEIAATRAADEADRIKLMGGRDEAFVAQLQAVLQTCATEKDAYYDELREAVRMETMASEAIVRQQTARDVHRRIGEWVSVASLCSPDGIPAEIMGRGLGQLNAALDSERLMASFPPVAVNADADIEVGGRHYLLCSESEQWRADAVIACAFARLSGWTLVLLDRFDVLAPGDRVAALEWLMSRGGPERVVMSATLKTKPELNHEHAVSYWIENGVLS